MIIHRMDHGSCSSLFLGKTTPPEQWDVFLERATKNFSRTLQKGEQWKIDASQDQYEVFYEPVATLPQIEKMLRTDFAEPQPTSFTSLFGGGDQSASLRWFRLRCCLWSRVSLRRTISPR